MTSHVTADEGATRAFRAAGADDAACAELHAYTQHAWVLPEAAAAPLADEPCVEAWAGYVEAARTAGAVPVLRDALLQLRFPVAAGTSAREDYQAAVRRGVPPADGQPGARFVDPAGIRLFLHPTAAGRIPVVVAEAREDFETLVRALTRRNEPEAIPASMGACIVGGYNNWDRVARLRRAWEAAHPGAAAHEWARAFQALMPQRERYQDRFVVLSAGPYSATPASAVGLDDATWRRLSLTIRLEHECAHYYTRRVFGAMQNALLDELIADWAGIVAAAGRYRADWQLQFLGLESLEGGGRWREGGRLANYRGTPPLSDAAFVALQQLVVRAVRTLAAHEASWPVPARARVPATVLAIARVGLAGLASDEGVRALGAALSAPSAPSDVPAPGHEGASSRHGTPVLT